MGYEVDEKSVAGFGYYLAGEASIPLPAIEAIAREEGLSPHGFTGAMEPAGMLLQGVPVTVVSGAFGLMQTKLCQLGDAVLDVAKHYKYREDSNESLLVRTGLDHATDREISRGDMAGIPGYERSDEVNRSRDFPVTLIDPFTADRPDTRFSDGVDYGPVLDVLNFIWTEFGIDPKGRDFVESIIGPLAGKPDSIKANGAAWRSVGANLGLVAANLGDNATNLATDYWKGDAADAFEHFLDRYWKRGAVWAGEQLGEFLAKGFDKLAEIAIAIADAAIGLIQIIFRIAERSALRSVPLLGQAWTVVEQLLDWFGVDVEGVISDVAKIRSAFEAIDKLYTTLGQMEETVRAYLATLQELVDTIEQIPDVDSLTEAAETATAIKDGKDALDAQKAALKEQAGAAGKALDELDTASRAAREHATTVDGN